MMMMLMLMMMMILTEHRVLLFLNKSMNVNLNIIDHGNEISPCVPSLRHPPRQRIRKVENGI